LIFLHHNYLKNVLQNPKRGGNNHNVINVNIKYIDHNRLNLHLQLSYDTLDLTKLK